jgi:enoyl-CoA hydratase/carnithine racemase
MTMSGTVFKSAEEASEAGVVSELVDGDGLADRAREIARDGKGRGGDVPRWIGDSDVRSLVGEAAARVREGDVEGEAAEAVLGCVECGLSDGWGSAIAMERSELCRLRHTEAGRRAIEAFFDRSAKK